MIDLVDHFAVTLVASGLILVQVDTQRWPRRPLNTVNRATHEVGVVEEVVVANERWRWNLGKVGVLAEPLQLGFVKNGPEQAEFEQGVDRCCC